MRPSQTTFSVRQITPTLTSTLTAQRQSTTRELQSSDIRKWSRKKYINAQTQKKELNSKENNLTWHEHTPLLFEATSGLCSLLLALVPAAALLWKWFSRCWRMYDGLSDCPHFRWLGRLPVTVWSESLRESPCWSNWRERRKVGCRLYFCPAARKFLTSRGTDLAEWRKEARCQMNASYNYQTLIRWLLFKFKYDAGEHSLSDWIYSEPFWFAALLYRMTQLWRMFLYDAKRSRSPLCVWLRRVLASISEWWMYRHLLIG